MSIQRLGYLGFESSNLDAWRRFAAEKIGIMECAVSSDQVRFRVDSRAWRIAVHSGETDDLAYAGYEVDSEEALAAVKKRLDAHGIAVVDEDQTVAQSRGVLGLISCKDPWDNRIEIYYGATEVFERPFCSPSGVSGFITEEQGLGHYVLNVPDVDAAIQFYIKALGFHLSDIIDWQIAEGMTVQAYFLHCNTRHHTLAFGKLPLEKRIHHFMLETGTLDDVGLAYDRFEADHAIVSTLGRHSNDHMLSFYGATPSGFAVEYGWGARKVEQDWSVVRYDSISVWGHKFVAPG
jgi:biphenyl-2,3-diol 1,2-dioxygenase/3-methylcatechol 2,3-dioxygenase